MSAAAVAVVGSAPIEVREQVRAALAGRLTQALLVAVGNVTGVKCVPVTVCVDIPSAVTTGHAAAAGDNDEGESPVEPVDFIVRSLFVDSAMSPPIMVADDIMSQLTKLVNPIKFVSTRGKAKPTTFLGAILEGLASDGGLYVPEANPVGTLPSYWLKAVCSTPDMPYVDLAQLLLERFVDLGQLPLATLRTMIEKAYDDSHWTRAPSVDTIAPITLISHPTKHMSGRRVFTCELFNGPTAAFKDFALQLFPQVFAFAAATLKAPVASTGRPGTAGSAKVPAADVRNVILTATSGDTGVAAIDGFKTNAPDVPVMVLYPKDGVSVVQKLQMLSHHGGNIAVLGVEGANFDFCQSTVKAIFNDRALQEALLRDDQVKLSSANSINWGRLFPQMVYYVAAYQQCITKKVTLPSAPLPTESPARSVAAPVAATTAVPILKSYGEEIELCVPTGNFGNVLAGFYAKRYFGLTAIKRFIIAGNSNDVVVDFINTAGKYNVAGKSLVTTASPSIDILRASNVERFLWLCMAGDGEKVRGLMTDLETRQAFFAPLSVERILKKEFAAAKCSEDECGAMIGKVLETTDGKVLLDPHTAVGVHVASIVPLVVGEGSHQSTSMRSNVNPVVTVVCATAHWSKFPEPVVDWLQVRPAEDVLPKGPLGVAATKDNVVSMYTAISDAFPNCSVAVPLQKIFFGNDAVPEAETIAADRAAIVERLRKLIKDNGPIPSTQSSPTRGADYTTPPLRR